MNNEKLVEQATDLSLAVQKALNNGTLGTDRLVSVFSDVRTLMHVMPHVKESEPAAYKVLSLTYPSVIYALDKLYVAPPATDLTLDNIGQALIKLGFERTRDARVFTLHCAGSTHMTTNIEPEWSSIKIAYYNEEGRPTNIWGARFDEFANVQQLTEYVRNIMAGRSVLAPDSLLLAIAPLTFMTAVGTSIVRETQGYRYLVIDQGSELVLTTQVLSTGATIRQTIPVHAGMDVKTMANAINARVEKHLAYGKSTSMQEDPDFINTAFSFMGLNEKLVERDFVWNGEIYVLDAGNKVVYVSTLHKRSTVDVIISWNYHNDCVLDAQKERSTKMEAAKNLDSVIQAVDDRLKELGIHTKQSDDQYNGVREALIARSFIYADEQFILEGANGVTLAIRLEQKLSSLLVELSWWCTADRTGTQMYHRMEHFGTSAEIVQEIDTHMSGRGIHAGIIVTGTKTCRLPDAEELPVVPEPELVVHDYKYMDADGQCDIALGSKLAGTKGFGTMWRDIQIKYTLSPDALPMSPSLFLWTMNQALGFVKLNDVEYSYTCPITDRTYWLSYDSSASEIVFTTREFGVLITDRTYRPLANFKGVLHAIHWVRQCIAQFDQTEKVLAGTPITSTQLKIVADALGMSDHPHNGSPHADPIYVLTVESGTVYSIKLNPTLQALIVHAKPPALGATETTMEIPYNRVSTLQEVERKVRNIIDELEAKSENKGLPELVVRDYVYKNALGEMSKELAAQYAGTAGFGADWDFIQEEQLERLNSDMPLMPENVFMWTLSNALGFEKVSDLTYSYTDPKTGRLYWIDIGTEEPEIAFSTRASTSNVLEAVRRPTSDFVSVLHAIYWVRQCIAQFNQCADVLDEAPITAQQLEIIASSFGMERQFTGTHSVPTWVLKKPSGYEYTLSRNHAWRILVISVKLPALDTNKREIEIPYSSVKTLIEIKQQVRNIINEVEGTDK